MFATIKGYRTYVVAVAGLFYAAIGFLNGWLDAVQAWQFVQVSLAAMGIRAAIK